MYHIGILYATYDDLYKNVVDIICNSINENKYDIKVKKAGDAAMPDIAASDIIIFITPAHDEFSEIIRALKGINLSGRLAGFVEFASEEGQNFLEDVLKDTGVSYCKDVLNIVNGKIEKGKIKNWTKGILEKYEGIIYDRG